MKHIGVHLIVGTGKITTHEAISGLAYYAKKAGDDAVKKIEQIEKIQKQKRKDIEEKKPVDDPLGLF